DGAIADIIDRMDMWDHIAYCNADNGAAILRNPKLRLSRYKAGLYLDRGEVDPTAIAETLDKPGNGVILEDPRGMMVALDRPLGKVSSGPVAPVSAEGAPERPARDGTSLWERVRTKTAPRAGDSRPTTIDRWIVRLRDAEDWKQVAESAEEQQASAERILSRAWVADLLWDNRVSSPEALAALEDRVRHRSLHKAWMY